jgi:hypothetical protein
MLRRHSFLKKVQSIDAFPKIESNIQLTTNSGGLVTVILSLFLSYLCIHQIWQYLQIRQKYEFLVDQSRASQLQVNVDLTVQTQCQCTLSHY